VTCEKRYPGGLSRPWYTDPSATTDQGRNPRRLRGCGPGRLPAGGL